MGTALSIIGIRILEAVFVFGLIGSAVVIVIVTVQDFLEVFDRDETEPQNAGVKHG